MIPEVKRTAFFTICSKNYVHYARVWARSVTIYHPDADVYLYLADRSDGHIDQRVEPFSLVEAHELSIPDFQRFAFRYDIMEFNTAIKPYCFSDLIRRGHRNVIFMDPDTRIYAPLDDVISHLEDGAPAVLTPHSLSPNEHAEPPNDFTFLRCGIYNLGFIALRNTSKIAELISWWERRLVLHCVSNRLSDGLFVDQKWVDLWPAYCPGTVILHHPGYNVAYWNLDERPLKQRDGAITVHEVPLKFFHFSGIEPGNRSVLSKHQKRLTPASLGDASALFEEYHDDLENSGMGVTKSWPYAYANFSNGEKIPAIARWLYREELGENADDPFSDLVPLLNAPANVSPDANAIITRMSHYLWLKRTDLREAFDLRDRASQVQYAQWFLTRAPEEMGMPPCLTTPVRQRLAQLDNGVHCTDSKKANAHRTGLRRIVKHISKATRRTVRYLGRARGNSDKHRTAANISESARDRLSDSGSIAYSESAKVRVVADVAAPCELRDGVSIIGYPYGEFGVAEGLRSLVRSAIDAGIPTDVYNFDVHVQASQRDRSIEALVNNRLATKVNILCINADMLQESMSVIGPAAFAGRYNIIRPFWELSNINEQWIPALERMDEVWAPTTFVKDAFSKALKRPVFHVPVAVEVNPPTNPSRGSFDLPSDKFLFLFSFDLRSYWQRKNPDAVIDAFFRAFGASQSDVALVIKTMGSSNDRSDVLERLRGRVAADPRVYFIDAVLDRARAIELIAACDAFISLHRSEGFGFGMAEAMSLGKPVIGTAYSGCTDFLNEQTGYPVRYELVPVREGDYPYYQPGQVWANPDVIHASELMRHIYEHQSQARAVAQAGRSLILEKHSSVAVGRTMLGRLQAIGVLDTPKALKEAGLVV